MQFSLGSKPVDHPQLGPDQRYLRVFGVRPSGNHAIIRFLMQNCPDAPAFLNNTVLRRPPGNCLVSLEQDGEILAMSDADMGRPILAESQGVLTQQVYRALEPRKFIIAFMEEQIRGENFVASARNSWGGGRATDLIVYRSFLNWLASAYRHPTRFPGRQIATVNHLGQLLTLMAFWSAHAHLATSPNAPRGFVPVNFDSWLVDEKYRADLLKHCGLPQQDLGLPAQSPYGRGSSFGDIADGASLEPDDVKQRQSRAERMSSDPIFCTLLKLAAEDPELVGFVKSLFPEDYDLWMWLCRQAEAA